MSDLRSVDPSEVWVRHVVRGTEGDPTAQPLGRVYFVRADATAQDGMNGRSGWQAAQTTALLEEDGTFQIELANVAGDDGVLHRERFAYFTDPYYEPGEEWLEFYRDPNDLLFVGTPTDGEKTKSKVILSGKDLNVVLAGSLSSDVDAWDAHAPADVLRHYTRLPVIAYGANLAVPLSGESSAWGTPYTQALTNVSTDCWSVEARLRWTAPRPVPSGSKGKLGLNIAGMFFQVDVYEGEAAFIDGFGLTGPYGVTGRRTGLIVPGPVDLRIVARYDHLFAFCAGELVAEWRRPDPWRAVPSVTVEAYGGTAMLDGLKVDTLAPFAGRGASAVIDRVLPGIPPATGLRSQFWNAAGVYAQNAGVSERAGRLWANEDPAVDRVDPTVNFAGSSTATPNIAGAYAARWSGAIYLDLAASDRDLILGTLTEPPSGHIRAYIGRTLRDEPAIDAWWGAGTTVKTGLRSWLGSVSGWYPIVIEQTFGSPTLGMILQDRASGGTYGVVPQSRLSPIGVYSDLVRYTNHRQVIGDVAQAFGYQWRVEHRSLESDEFPGQLTFQPLLGRLSNKRITEDDMGTEAQVQVAATDVVDGLVADAAGIADPRGSGQLTAQVVDYTRDHLALRQGYESLADISEAPLLQQRMDSLLALRSSPNEQVGVRPSGQRDVVDTFPLSGSLAKLDWEPGDGVILDLEAIGVKDLSPRQLMSVSWPLRPNGVGAPTVGFRQRPRSVKAAMQRLSRAIYAPRQNYQGSVAIVTGTTGGADSAGFTVPGAADAYSRAPLPSNLNDVVKVVVVVQGVTGTGWRLEITGVDVGTPAGLVDTTGRYDITDSATALGIAPIIYARLRNGASGSYFLMLEVWVKV
jgi:hypothetical protein